MRALTADQVRLVEARAVTELGLSLAQLMERAGSAVAHEVAERFPEGSIVSLCGPGNNGGDGWVAAARLANSGRSVRVLTMRDPEALPEPARAAALDAIRNGVPFDIVAEDTPSADTLFEVDVVIDALLGIGTGLPLKNPIAGWCAAINESPAAVVAIDIPTGCDSDTGQADDCAVVADCTVTFFAPKRGLVVFPSAGRAGEIVVADLGVPARFAEITGAPEVWSPAEYASLLPLPAPDAHKNSRGRVLVVAGSSRFPGAAILAARGAMHSGAGYVTLAVPEPVVAIAQAHLLACPVVGLPASRSRSFSSNAAHVVLDLAAEYDAVVLGPGLTLSDGAVAMARAVVARLGKPLLVDADALNALVDTVELVAGRSAPTVLTPHPGELGRLLGVRTSDVQADRISSSAALAGPSRAVVLKGAGTIVSEGERQVIITAGTPALATAGTGDVLAGVIGTLLAQGLSALEASAVGAYVHARAGEAAAAELTPLCVTAEDLPSFIPVAVAELLQTW